MDTFDLSHFFKTKSQANDFTARLTTISHAVYQSGFNLEAALAETFGLRKKDKFIALLRENNISAESSAALTEFLTRLQEKVSQLPVLSITLAFEPKEQTLKSLSDWFLINKKSQVLFDIRVDESLIAGVAIEYQGKYIDYSTKPLVARILTDVITQKTQPAQVAPEQKEELLPTPPHPATPPLQNAEPIHPNTHQPAGHVAAGS